MPSELKVWPGFLRGFDASVMEVRRTLRAWKEANKKEDK